MVKHKLSFEYNKITDYIYIGTNQCCQVHFKKELLNKGIKADISLEKERLDSPFGVDYFLWLPTKDRFPPSQKQLKTGTDFIKSLVKNKIKVYVHCMHGHGRAPTLVAAYFISQGKTVEQAIKMIKNKRPEIHPNEKQINALKKFKEV
jgi:protein-tyrosine phosphatase